MEKGTEGSSKAGSSRAFQSCRQTGLLPGISPPQGEVSVIYDTRVVTVFAAARSGAAQGAGTCRRLEGRRALASRGGTSPSLAVTPFLRPSPGRQSHRPTDPLRSRLGMAPRGQSESPPSICRGPSRPQTLTLYIPPTNTSLFFPLHF